MLWHKVMAHHVRMVINLILAEHVSTENSKSPSTKPGNLRNYTLSVKIDTWDINFLKAQPSLD